MTYMTENQNSKCHVLKSYEEYCEVTNKFLIELLNDETPGTIEHLARRLTSPQGFVFIISLLDKPICTLGELGKCLNSLQSARSLFLLGQQAGLVKNIFIQKKVGEFKYQIFLRSSYRKILLEKKELN